MNLRYKLLLILFFTFLPFLPLHQSVQGMLFTSKIQAAEYYVAVNGSDSNGYDIMNGGDTVLVHGGVYRERVTIDASKSDTADIIIVLQAWGKCP